MAKWDSSLFILWMFYLFQIVLLREFREMQDMKMGKLTKAVVDDISNKSHLMCRIKKKHLMSKAKFWQKSFSALIQVKKPQKSFTKTNVKYIYIF